MKRGIIYVVLLCLCFSFAVRTAAQQPTRKLPPRPVVTRKATAAEKIFREGICKSPSSLAWINAYNVDNIPISSRSDSTFVRLPDALLRAQLLLHIFAAAKVKELYDAKSYKTEVFPTAYKEHKAGLSQLFLKYEDAVKSGSGATVSGSDRRALYPVIKAYLIDTALTIQEIPKASMRGSFAAVYGENEQAIGELAKSKPSEGLSEYSDAKEKPVFEAMTAYLIDFAGFVQATHPSGVGSKLAAAYQENQGKIEALATAPNLKAREMEGEELNALRSILEASALDVAVLLSEAHKTSNKTAFKEAYARNAAAIETLLSEGWKDPTRSTNAARALCEVLPAY